MKIIKRRLINLLTLNRNVSSHPDTGSDDHLNTNLPVVTEDQGRDTEFESQQAANDSDDRPDWFQAIHGREYYND